MPHKYTASASPASSIKPILLISAAFIVIALLVLIVALFVLVFPPASKVFPSQSSEQPLQPTPRASTTSAHIMPTASPSATPSSTPQGQLSITPLVQSARAYPWHRNIMTTVFWVGEAASEDNAGIPNHQSFWSDDWVKSYGGVDSPDKRNEWLPQSFTPKENPFYFALPYGDYANGSLKDMANIVPWYRPIREEESLLKNRWVQISYQGRSAYAQWEDVGPYRENDVEYVFGNKPPQERVGLDVSPAVKGFLGLTGMTPTDWRFVEANDVPPGPWLKTVTHIGPQWE